MLNITALTTKSIKQTLRSINAADTTTSPLTGVGIGEVQMTTFFYGTKSLLKMSFGMDGFF